MTGLRSPPYHRFCEYQQTVEDWSVYLCQGTCSNRIRHSRSPVGCKGFIRARVTGSDGLVPGDERIWWRQTCFSIVRNLLIVCFPPKLPFFFAHAHTGFVITQLIENIQVQRPSPIRRRLYTTHMHQITLPTMKDDHMQLSTETLVGVNRTYMYNLVEINF